MDKRQWKLPIYRFQLLARGFLFWLLCVSVSPAQNLDGPEAAKTKDADKDSGKQEIGSLKGPSVKAFGPFSKTASAKVEGQYLVVESNGLPDHGMMVGIRSWQQQVPLPQPFSGDNAWRIPLNPQPAQQPISVLKNSLRGAIALAVNGVPIFCALNNRGDDTYLAGELDRWGGHCGRGDDYHYHIAPVHLEEKAGRGNPIAFALDGFPLLGFGEADGSIPRGLDKFNGHVHGEGCYHYHATKEFPYVNGGLKGVVKLDRDQVAQPQGANYRSAQSPLRGATVTKFNREGNSYFVEYEMQNGSTGSVEYIVWDNEQVDFTYTSPSGAKSKSSYKMNSLGGGGVGVYLIWGLPIGLGLTAVFFIRRRRIKKEE